MSPLIKMVQLFIVAILIYCDLEMTRSFIFLVPSLVAVLLLLRPIRCQRRLANPCGSRGESVAIRHNNYVVSSCDVMD